MVAVVPPLGGALFITNPESIIGYTLQRYFRTPKNAVPLLDDLIISLPWRVAENGGDPETLCQNIRGDLQGVYDRVFGSERRVTVTVDYLSDQTDKYEVTITIMYTAAGDELKSTGTSIRLVGGRLVIPEDNFNSLLKR